MADGDPNAGHPASSSSSKPLRYTAHFCTQPSFCTGVCVHGLLLGMGDCVLHPGEARWSLPEGGSLSECCLVQERDSPGRKTFFDAYKI